MMQTNLLFFYTETSLHAGTGAGLSSVDLPIQRERTTQYPNIQGSGVKGALRSQVMDAHEAEIAAVFGRDPQSQTKSNDYYAGAVSIGEARIILFPVRSLIGVFAYVTCPAVIARLERDLTMADIEKSWPHLTVPENQCLVTGNGVTADKKVVLEEFSFEARLDEGAADLADWLAQNALPDGNEYHYWRDKLRHSLVVLHDNDFRDFVVNSTEVVTRVRLAPDTKTVATGALWTQEMLPADTLMMSAVTARRVRMPDSHLNTDVDVQTWLGEHLPARLQIGGDETTGQGVVAVRWQEGANRE